MSPWNINYLEFKVAYEIVEAKSNSLTVLLVLVLEMSPCEKVLVTGTSLIFHHR